MGRPTGFSLSEGTLIGPVMAGLLHYGQLFSRTRICFPWRITNYFLRYIFGHGLRRRKDAGRGIRNMVRSWPDKTRWPIPHHSRTSKCDGSPLVPGDQRAVCLEMSRSPARVAITNPLDLRRVSDQYRLHILVHLYRLPVGPNFFHIIGASVARVRPAKPIAPAIFHSQHRRFLPHYSRIDR